MSNEIIFVASVLIYLGSVLLLYKLFYRNALRCVACALLRLWFFLFLSFLKCC